MEDIIDTGATLKAVLAKLRDLGAASVKSAVLLNKEERRNVVIEPDYAALKARAGSHDSRDGMQVLLHVHSTCDSAADSRRCSDRTC